jgi:hypothetical protein
VRQFGSSSTLPRTELGCRSHRPFLDRLLIPDHEENTMKSVPEQNRDAARQRARSEKRIAETEAEMERSAAEIQRLAREGERRAQGDVGDIVPAPKIIER